MKSKHVNDVDNTPTPRVLPRPDFRFPGEVGRTYPEFDPAQFPKPVQAQRVHPTFCSS